MYNYIKYVERKNMDGLSNVIQKKLQQEYNNHPKVVNHIETIKKNEALIKVLKEYK
ncbi:hypothetical protein F356_168 [Campylobacter phage F356]|uniref:Uncharacterized protein n=2 Tax=Fletchervirus CPX TaxID=1110702 RepID=A0A7T3KEM7_9CAUD|nr:hypothetical protein F355_166 [Campylobacter phage F355]QPX63806.1 hypothetical protein F356_168 [Campylobacter phage F356]